MDERVRAADEGAGRERPRILVVDDEAAVRQFLKVVLERMGYRVDVASGGAEALSLVEKKSYDVVLTDLVMPRIDGIQVIESVKKTSPDTEVLIITGYPSSETIVAAMRAGAVDYLPKSPDPQHLAALIEKAVDIRDLRRKARERDYYLRMAQMDGLTELFNHSAFHGFLDREMARAKRGERPLSVLLAESGSLTAINREYGHVYADRVLRRVAGVLRANCRVYDVVARYQDGEFAVLAPETDRAGARVLAHRLSSAVKAAQGAGEQCEIPLALSVGLASFPQDADSADSLVGKADTALASARNAGDGSIRPK